MGTHYAKRANANETDIACQLLFKNKSRAKNRKQHNKSKQMEVRLELRRTRPNKTKYATGIDKQKVNLIANALK